MEVAEAAARGAGDRARWNMTTPSSDFLAAVRETIEIAGKFKRQMQKRGKTYARTTCPKCGGQLHGVISGPRNHFQMRCMGIKEGKGCGLQMIE
jgi:4-hydroxy-3-methylbut-2-en-1-yl diphosphate synthase IspG/GcpE